MDTKTHIEKSLNKIRPIFEKAGARIDALKPGEKVPATSLADEIAKEYGMTGPQVYPVLKFLFEDFPGVQVRRGAHGGLIKLDPNAEVKSEETEKSESTDKNVAE